VKLKAIATACVAASLMVGQPAPVMADSDGLVGGIVGGIIGGVIVNEANKKRSATTTHRSTSSKPSVSSAQREANREVQTSLNYFGFPVGTPDGSIGPRSRAAISTYQATLGYPATGQLTDFERDLLVTSYYRAQAGGATTAQMIATHPQGVRGMLLTFRDERLGVAPAAVAAAPAAPLAPAPSQAVTAAASEAPAGAAPALPSFMAQGATQVSLASQCNKISLQTNTNGGYTTVAAMSDPNFALSEQFCLARTYAMSQGEDMAAQVTGVTPAQIAEQCQAFGPVLAPQVAALSLQARDEVLADTRRFVLSSGMAPAQLAATAKICLGVGYTTDKLDVAIGSALLLTALGEKAYAELVGHHLSQGFGTSRRPDLSLAWYEVGLEAETTGVTVFAPGLPDRTALIRQAAYSVGGKLELAPAGGAQVLPVFSLPEPAPATANP